MYRRRRYPTRRSPRRRYSRYPMRRYRSPQLNDSERRTMSFVQNMVVDITVPAGSVGSIASIPPQNILSGSLSGTNTVPSAGRIFYAGCMYDRLRFLRVSVQCRPKTLPAGSGAPNYTFHAAWDRYLNDLTGSELTANPRTVTDDPSAKMVVWTPGGSGTPLTHYVTSVAQDRHQYNAIEHTVNSSGIQQWGISGTLDATFAPTLRYVLDVGTSSATPLVVPVVFLFRFTLEFMGAASIAVGEEYVSAVADAPLASLASRVASMGSIPLRPRL